MSSAPFDATPSFWRQIERDSLDDAGANGTRISRLVDDEPAFSLPAPLFEQLPFAVYICDRNGIVLRYNRRAAELWGRAPKVGDLNEQFCGSYKMFRPDGSLLPHHQCPMADVLRTGVSVREQEVHIERPDGMRGIALVDIEAIKDGDGNIVGAINCFQDITERKRTETQIVDLAHEAEHRTKNILSTVLATVRLSHSDTVDDLKQLIEGRINALAKVHALFVQSRWKGAELRHLVTQELLPYGDKTEARVRIDGPAVMLEPYSAQAIAICLHELATNAAKYGALSTARGRVEIVWSRMADGWLSVRWIEASGPAVTPPTHRGFGARIMENIVGGQLGGRIRLDWRDQGLACEITLPTASPCRHARHLPALTGWVFFAVMRVAAVFVRLLGISGFLPSHVARIIMILAIRIFAGLLLVRVFVVIIGHMGVPSEGGTTSNCTAAPKFLSASWLIPRVAHFRSKSRYFGLAFQCRVVDTGLVTALPLAFIGDENASCAPASL